MKRHGVFAQPRVRKFLALFSVLLVVLVILLLILLNNRSQQAPGKPTTQTGSPVTHAEGRCSGVTRNAGGAFEFSWLHVDSATYTIRDENNCVVVLRGIVQPAAFGDAGATITRQEVDLLSQNIQVNFWRLNLN